MYWAVDACAVNTRVHKQDKFWSREEKTAERKKVVSCSLQLCSTFSNSVVKDYSVDMGTETNKDDRSSPEYLAQLLKDKKQLQALPNIFIHAEKVLNEGKSRPFREVFCAGFRVAN